MAVKKSKIYGALWASCDELRGGMDASEYKDYILTLLFMKYVTDRFKNNRYGEIKVDEGGGFDDLIAAKNSANIGERINTTIAKLAQDNNLAGVIDIADFDSDDKIGSGAEKIEKLTKLISIFEDAFDFSANQAGGDDIIGDAYEYLMRHFATESGKSKGQFYTPAEVSRVIAKIIGASGAKSADETIYDPACGSGSLLIRASDEAPYGLSIYGQESESRTAGLAKMNLVLHNKATATIKGGKSTFSAPQYFDGEAIKRFDYVVANPPFSYKAWTTGLTHKERFVGFGAMPPAKNGDFAWLIHCLRSMKPNAKGAIILPHGVLFRGGAEAAIRKSLIDQKVIKGIIGLPPNLFYGTGIPACIIVLDKENAVSRTGIYIVDASRDFVKDGAKNRLRERDVKKIVDFFGGLLESEPKYARFVPFAEIEANGFNLNIPRYINGGEKEDSQDITAHLCGLIAQADIDALEPYWKAFEGMRERLFENSDRNGYLRRKVAIDDILETIFQTPSYLAYGEKLNAAYASWKNANINALADIKKGANIKTLIADLSESILREFSQISLIDKYDIYEALLTYWNDVMQDDAYAVAADGYEAAREIEKELTSPKKGTPKLKSFEGKLIGKKLLIDIFFAPERDGIANLESEYDEAIAQMQTAIEEQGGEDGLLSEALDAKGEVAKNLLKSRLKEIENAPDNADEYAALFRYQTLLDNAAALKRNIADDRAALDKAVLAKYPALTIDEIKETLIDKKWSADIYAKIDAIYQNVLHRLSSRITELAKRYERSLGEIEKEVEEYEEKVKSHLKEMGFAW